MEEQPYQMDAFVSQGLAARNVKLVSEHLTYSLYMWTLVYTLCLKIVHFSVIYKLKSILPSPICTKVGEQKVDTLCSHCLQLKQDNIQITQNRAFKYIWVTSLTFQGPVTSSACDRLIPRVPFLVSAVS